MSLGNAAPCLAVPLLLLPEERPPEQCSAYFYIICHLFLVRCSQSLSLHTKLITVEKKVSGGGPRRSGEPRPLLINALGARVCFSNLQGRRE